MDSMRYFQRIVCVLTLMLFIAVTFTGITLIQHEFPADRLANDYLVSNFNTVQLEQNYSNQLKYKSKLVRAEWENRICWSEKIVGLGPFSALVLMGNTWVMDQRDWWWLTPIQAASGYIGG